MSCGARATQERSADGTILASVFLALKEIAEGNG